MELLPIGSDKLKVTLTEADMDVYRLSADSLDWNDTGTRKALWSILDEAKKRCGFDAARERVLVQIFPSLTGGCEMFVTRVGKDRAEDEICIPAPIKRSGSRACFFDKLDDMLGFCRVLDSSEYADPSDAYFTRDGRYLLIYCRDDPRASEFGRVCPASDVEYYIGEHTDIIRRGDAVAWLARLC